jgi:outer membrane immunogenic protein
MKLPVLTLVSSLAVFSAAHAAEIFGGPAPERFGYSWTGAYVGVFGGLTTGDFSYDAGAVGGPSVLSADVSGGGALGGAQVGYDWQTGAFVFGAVADIAATNHDAEINASVAGFGSASASSELAYLGTVRGRFGAAFDRALIYGHGGFAYGKTEQDIEVAGTSIFSGSTSKAGWVVGAGLEYGLTDAVSFQTEYSYVDLGSDEVFNDGTIFVEEDVSFHTVKAAVNFRF